MQLLTLYVVQYPKDSQLFGNGGGINFWFCLVYRFFCNSGKSSVSQAFRKPHPVSQRSLQVNTMQGNISSPPETSGREEFCSLFPQGKTLSWNWRRVGNDQSTHTNSFWRWKTPPIFGEEDWEKRGDFVDSPRAQNSLAAGDQVNAFVDYCQVAWPH